LFVSAPVQKSQHRNGSQGQGHGHGQGRGPHLTHPQGHTLDRHPDLDLILGQGQGHHHYLLQGQAPDLDQTETGNANLGHGQGRGPTLGPDLIHGKEHLYKSQGQKKNLSQGQGQNHRRSSRDKIQELQRKKDVRVTHNASYCHGTVVLIDVCVTYNASFSYRAVVFIIMVL
jgi:hypothetical protein